MNVPNVQYAREDARIAYCDSYLHKLLVRENATAISVAIEQHGRLSYAYAESAKEESFSLDTPLSIMSITKILTSTLWLGLMEKGVVSLYDSIRYVIPEFPFDDIQFLHLLTHTSGLHGKFTIAEKVHDYSSLTRESPVDSVFKYYSSGYDIIADAIERIVCMDIGEYAREKILTPLGMTSSRYASHMGQAGMWSTVPDLIRFGRQLLNIKAKGEAGILRPCTVDLMFRDSTKGRFDRTPAFFLKSQTRRFGRYFGDLNSPEAVGHAGSSGCFFLLDPKYDTVQIILSNGSVTIQDSDENFNRVNNLLLGQFCMSL